MCTELKKEKTWFLPFNKGHNDGAGNPPNPSGIKTDYLWKEILTKSELSNILENYAQVVCEEDEETKKKTYKQIFPDFTESPAKSPREYAMSGNPLFISVLNSPISQPLTSIPRTQRGSRQCRECQHNTGTNLPPQYTGIYRVIFIKLHTYRI